MVVAVIQHFLVVGKGTRRLQHFIKASVAVRQQCLQMGSLVGGGFWAPVLFPASLLQLGGLR